jgi:hypothetical protein
MTIRPINAREVGWIDLVASVKAETNAMATTPKDNLLRQFKRALLHLEKDNLVELVGKQNTNGRFEYFRLLDESGTRSPAGSLVQYVVPKWTHEHPIPYEPPISVSADFFLNGWVHVLSAAEIATYLMLCHLSEQYPDEHDEAGVFVTDDRRKNEFTLSRDTYEYHQTLSWYGLIRRLRNTNRRENGTVKSFKIAGNPLEPHRFQVVPSILRRNAFEVVTGALQSEMLLLRMLIPL